MSITVSLKTVEHTLGWTWNRNGIIYPDDCSDPKNWNTNYNQWENYDQEIMKFLERINNSQSKGSLLWQYPTELMPKFTYTVSNKIPPDNFFFCYMFPTTTDGWLESIYLLILSILKNQMKKSNFKIMKWPSTDFWCLV